MSEVGAQGILALGPSEPLWPHLPTGQVILLPPCMAGGDVGRRSAEHKCQAFLRGLPGEAGGEAKTYLRSLPSFYRKNRKEQGALLLSGLPSGTHNDPIVPHLPSPALPEPGKSGSCLPLPPQAQEEAGCGLLRPSQVPVPEGTPKSWVLVMLTRRKTEDSFPTIEDPRGH